MVCPGSFWVKLNVNDEVYTELELTESVIGGGGGGLPANEI